MEWKELYTAEQCPTAQQISQYVNTPLWDALCLFLENTYAIEPRMEYSRCGMAPGWNVKYKKSGRAVCTLYPGSTTFVCLLVVGEKEAVETELLLPSLHPQIQQAYFSVKPYIGGRWLSIDVNCNQILQDVQALLQIRTKPTKR